ncbi:MAG TPA: hypothetical protein VNT52_01580 [Acidimicrobiales bacterium]|jgi:hypothetical protein|nr:hypothetical protein [Acidimicrobiales bacterium]
MTTIRSGRISRLVVTSVLAMGISTGIAGAAAAVTYGEDFPGGESALRQECLESGGTYTKSIVRGTVKCTYPNGTVIYCEEGAKSCITLTPKPMNHQRGSTVTYGSSTGALAS